MFRPNFNFKIPLDIEFTLGINLTQANEKTDIVAIIFAKSYPHTNKRKHENAIKYIIKTSTRYLGSDVRISAFCALIEQIEAARVNLLRNETCLPKTLNSLKPLTDSLRALRSFCVSLFILFP